MTNAVGAGISMKEKITRKMRRRVTTAVLDIITKTILKSTRAQNSAKIYRENSDKGNDGILT